MKKIMNNYEKMRKIHEKGHKKCKKQKKLIKITPKNKKNEMKMEIR